MKTSHFHVQGIGDFDIFQSIDGWHYQAVSARTGDAIAAPSDPFPTEEQAKHAAESMLS